MKKSKAYNENQDLQQKRLTLSQKAQIRIRKSTDKKPHWIFPLIACVVCFVLMIVTDKIPHATITADANDYENIGLQLTFTGDTILSRYVQDIADNEGYEALFEDTKAVWVNSDFVFTNLEYALLINDVSEYTKVKKQVNLYGYTDTIYALLNAGMNVFSYANNHTSDYGEEAFLEGIAWMWENDISFSGYNLTAESYTDFAENETLLEMYEEFQKEAYTTLTADNGTTIGFLSVVSPHTSDASLSSYVLKTYSYNLYQYVSDAAINTDLTVVYLHAGTESILIPEDYQVETAYELIDAGADIVIMSHTHSLLPIEFYKDGIIFYGLGNFIIDQNTTNSRDSVIVQYNCNENGGYFELIPARINNGITQLTASSYYINRINSMLTKYLSDDDYYYDSTSGHVIIPWSKG